jgi:hypothetical protein
MRIRQYKNCCIPWVCYVSATRKNRANSWNDCHSRVEVSRQQQQAEKNLLGFRARCTRCLASRISSLASGRGGPRYCGGQQSAKRIKKAAVVPYPCCCCCFLLRCSSSGFGGPGARGPPYWVGAPGGGGTHCSTQHSASRTPCALCVALCSVLALSACSSPQQAASMKQEVRFASSF